MSMGPVLKDEAFKTGKVEQFKASTKKIVIAYFENPLHYLFYLSLTGLIGCLFFGVRISWQLYIIISILACIEIVKKLPQSYGIPDQSPEKPIEEKKK